MMENKLKIWKVHPKAAQIVRAEPTLHNTANEQGVKWCKPYKLANGVGWWLFPPVDVDICWRGENTFEHRLLEPYSNSDHELVRSLVRPSDRTDIESWCPAQGGRSKFTWGAVEPAVVQVWTGLIFEMPPGWVLHIRSPINFDRRPEFSVMEGVIEADWMQYDIWTNLKFDLPDQWVGLRKDS